MGAKAKKAMKKQLSKAVSASAQKALSASSAQKPVPTSSTAAPDFLPLEGGPARKLPEEKLKEDVARVVYISRIPHGFYETEMQGFFGQFGVINRLRIVRNKKVSDSVDDLNIEFVVALVNGFFSDIINAFSSYQQTGKSKHFGFIEFEDPGVAKIVAETMHNYLLFECLLQTKLIPPQEVHPKLWKNSKIRAKPLNWVQIERKRHDKERTAEEHKKLVEKIKKRDLKRQKRIEAAGIEYKCPEIITNDQPAPKKKKLRLNSLCLKGPRGLGLAIRVRTQSVLKSHVPCRGLELNIDKMFLCMERRFCKQDGTGCTE
ncbi:hypothetical protein ACLB2K_045387 [Fragaria x ananassa]